MAGKSLPLNLHPCEKSSISMQDSSMANHVWLLDGTWFLIIVPSILSMARGSNSAGLLKSLGTPKSKMAFGHDKPWMNSQWFDNALVGIPKDSDCLPIPICLVVWMILILRIFPCVFNILHWCAEIGCRSGAPPRTKRILNKCGVSPHHFLCGDMLFASGG